MDDIYEYIMLDDKTQIRIDIIDNEYHFIKYHENNCNIQINIGVKKDIIHIHDFINHYNKGKGYGTKVLLELIKYYKNKDYKKITGYISDIDDIDRLYKYYSRLGFTITKSDKYEYKIEMNL